MTRARPVATDLPTYGPAFDAMCAAAEVHWRTALPPAEPGRFIVVDLMMQDLRLALRTLTLANALRRVEPAELIVLVDPPAHWAARIWDGYDQERLLQLARAFGCSHVVEVDALCTAIGNGATSLEIAGHSVPVREGGSDPQRLESAAESTAVRVLRIPTLHDANADDDLASIRSATTQLDSLYATLFDGLEVTALVVSHVDYSQWGLASDAAVRAAVPVLHAQATGGLKAYGLFPGAPGGELGFRRALTLGIARQFEEQVWRHRDALALGAERTAWRSKTNLGRPSWWRGGGEVSRLDLRETAERSALREHSLRALGLDPAKPVVTVFNHAVSDAVHGNHEAFPDLASWLEATVEHARAHSEVSWLFLDHPSQVNYDRTEHFERLARESASTPWLAFRPSLSLSRNALWSVTDLAVTVRGSVSSEFPCYGIPALQAGWSEWSHLGLSSRADTVEQYWSELSRCVAALVSGDPLITDEQVLRARLWLWFYRSGADVTSPLVPHWENGQLEPMQQITTTAMNHVEDDADPAYVAVHRMWTRRDPVLTRLDLATDAQDVQALLGVRVGERPSPPTELATAFDDLTAPTLPLEVTSGQDRHLRMVDGFVRGGAVVGRASKAVAVLVLDAGDIQSTATGRSMAIDLSVDQASATWWDDRTPHQAAPGQGRRIRVSVGGDTDTEVDLPGGPTPGTPASAVVTVDLPAGARLITVVLESDPDGGSTGRLLGGVARRLGGHQGPRRDSLVGVRVNRISIVNGAR